MPPEGSREIKDQLGNTVVFKTPIRSIVSLVPSQTELLFDLGLDHQIVGITKFCIHPADKCKQKAKVGGTKKVNIDRVRQLKPDLIIANKEENDRSQIDELARDYPVWVSDVKDLADAYQMIAALGKMLDCTTHSKIMIDRIKAKFSLLPSKTYGKAVYLIWRKPYLSVGSDTFIHYMMQCAGFENCLAHEERYPEISSDQLTKLDPEFVLLSSEPFPFKQTHIQEVEKLCPKAKGILVDGEMFSWYGSRLLKAPDYFLDRAEELGLNAH